MYFHTKSHFHEVVEKDCWRITCYFHQDTQQWSCTIRTEQYLYSGYGFTKRGAMQVAHAEKRRMEALYGENRCGEH